MKPLLILLTSAFSAFSVFSVVSPSPAAELHLGASTIDITPEEPVALDGKYALPATGIIQPELYTDYGIQMKARSPAVQTFVIQLAGPGTYLPTERAVGFGGYGAVIRSSQNRTRGRSGPRGGDGEDVRRSLGEEIAPECNHGFHRFTQIGLRNEIENPSVQSVVKVLKAGCPTRRALNAA